MESSQQLVQAHFIVLLLKELKLFGNQDFEDAICFWPNN